MAQYPATSATHRPTTPALCCRYRTYGCRYPLTPSSCRPRPHHPPTNPRLLPTFCCRYRTQLCNDGSNCKRKICFFAHSLDELRVPACKPFVSPEALAAAAAASATDAGGDRQGLCTDSRPTGLAWAEFSRGWLDPSPPGALHGLNQAGSVAAAARVGTARPGPPDPCCPPSPDAQTPPSPPCPAPPLPTSAEAKRKAATIGSPLAAFQGLPSATSVLSPMLSPPRNSMESQPSQEEVSAPPAAAAASMLQQVGLGLGQGELGAAGARGRPPARSG